MIVLVLLRGHCPGSGARFVMSVAELIQFRNRNNEMEIRKKKEEIVEGSESKQSGSNATLVMSEESGEKRPPAPPAASRQQLPRSPASSS